LDVMSRESSARLAEEELALWEVSERLYRGKMETRSIKAWCRHYLSLARAAEMNGRSISEENRRKAARLAEKHGINLSHIEHELLEGEAA
jgi:hypothetical protein